MKESLQALKQSALNELQALQLPAELEAFRVKFLGKKGELTALLKQMGTLSAEERPKIGEIANEVRERIEAEISKAESYLSKKALEKKLKDETLDITLPGVPFQLGHMHPLSIVIEEVLAIFLGMGYKIVEGPEVETTHYCFDALNTFEGHPARDMQDTFYINDGTILRTQTSSVQIRTMENEKPPIRIISPGRVFRKDEVDATHSPMFHQVEGLVVDKGITMADLKGTLDTLMKNIYGHNTKLRFRPHHFPYTEPSAEVDIQCFNCGGSGCRFCKNEGWIELLGSGMVHPQVLERCGIDPNVYSGFAFGVGLDRLAIMRFGITDLRHMFENDVRFLSQFGG